MPRQMPAASTGIVSQLGDLDLQAAIDLLMGQTSSAHRCCGVVTHDLQSSSYKMIFQSIMWYQFVEPSRNSHTKQILEDCRFLDSPSQFVEFARIFMHKIHSRRRCGLPQALASEDSEPAADPA